jgi:ATP synthase protein I
MKPKQQTSWQKSVREVGPYIDLGIRLALSIIIGVFGGLWLDKKIHTTPLFLLLGFALGAVSGFWSIYRSIYVKDQNNQNDDENK